MNGGTALLGGLSLLDIMTTWTEQKGYPVVKAEMNYSNGQITLNQVKYFELPYKQWFYLLIKNLL